MLYPNYDAFNITSKEGEYIGYIAEEDFFLLFYSESAISDEDGSHILRTIKDDILNSQIDHLHHFDSILSDKLHKLNLPAQSSVAAGFIKGDVLFLKTTNEGEIYLNRGSHFAAILSDNNTASGILHFHDFLIVTTKYAHQFIAEQGQHFTNHLHTTEPRLVSQTLLSRDDSITVQYPAALFIRIEKRDDVFPAYATPSATAVPVIDKLENQDSVNVNKKMTMSSKKFMTLIVAVLLGLVLIWSVGLGYQRREQQRRNKLIENARTSIAKKLDEASDISFLNTEKAVELIQQSKEEFTDLKTQLGRNSSNTDVQKIAELIQQKEAEIIKKEEKSFKEFYDLTLDSKGARGDAMFLSGDTIAILDKTNSKIYTLSLAKKSLNTTQNNIIKQTKLVALVGDTIFCLVPNEGVYRINNEAKSKKVIDDKSLKDIQDIAVYNSNIYLLDTIRGNVYKYTATADGFSNSNSYFNDKQDFSDSGSLAIDSAIYINKKNSIRKYSAGIPERFDTVLPDKDVHIYKVITNTDLNKVYAWDKENGKLYILGKDGSYVAQVQTNIFKEGTDMIVFQNSAYILKGQKVYKVDLE